MKMSDIKIEISKKKRFEFGRNWLNFVNRIDDKIISQAKVSLLSSLPLENLKEKSFLDVGSGSGLFSLAANRLGAKVYSFDYDPESVRCTRMLNDRFRTLDSEWIINQGSILDSSFVEGLGKFDIVYSWGVLHHTGDLNLAMQNIAKTVSENGYLFIAIYNDQGWRSKGWLLIKKMYVKLPKFLRIVLVFFSFLRLWGPTIVKDAIFRLSPLYSWKNYRFNGARGMNPWVDVIDWVGGLPFDVAKPEKIFDFFFARGFSLVKIKTNAGGLGCNEYVFIKEGTHG
jgi:2-polyprenyl-3-methyl-5-hydroxy-6-metoxy-1,4-benzoquinol methylase